MQVRLEGAADIAGVRAVNVAAFPTAAEADLVDRLRAQAESFISLVADAAGEVVGHIAFSPATLLANPGLPVMGLAPMAVTPERQRQGVGSALVRAGLEECARRKSAAVIVLGHADYYPRFGFLPASTFGIRCEYDVPDEVFMVRELQPGALTGVSGIARYHPAFAGL